MKAKNITQFFSSFLSLAKALMGLFIYTCTYSDEWIWNYYINKKHGIEESLFSCASSLVLNFILVFFYLLILGGDREREKHQFVVSLTYASIGWFLYVPWPGMKPATLAHGNDALTHLSKQPQPLLHWL